MMLEALCNDLEAECRELDSYVSGLPDEVWHRATGFFGWTVRDEILHLFQVDRFGLTSLRGADAFGVVLKDGRRRQGEGIELSEQIRREFAGVGRSDIMAAWRENYSAVLAALRGAPNGQRIAWFGPDMGLASFASARQMEVWAHGQDIYDAMGGDRPVHERVRNVCELGVRTFAWSFRLRELDAPAVPCVTLTLPSGSSLKWPGDGNGSVEGTAEQFALVVTQRRAVEDTALAVNGADAATWMRIAQCFAGAAQERAAPGSRPPLA